MEKSTFRILVILPLMMVISVAFPFCALGQQFSPFWTPLYVEPAYRDGLYIDNPMLMDGAVTFRVGNLVRRWVEIYGEAKTGDGRTIELGQLGTMGTFDNTLMIYRTLTPSLTDVADRVVYPDPNGPPLRIADVRQRDIREITIRCFGLGFDELEDLSPADFERFISASIPTLYFSLFEQAKNTLGGSPSANPIISGRPRESAIWHLLMEVGRKTAANSKGPLYQAIQNGEYLNFAGEFTSASWQAMIDVADENPKLFRDALAEYGVPRDKLLSGAQIGAALRARNLAGMTDSFYNFVLTAGALPFVGPIIEFKITIPTPEATLFLFDVSGSMAENNKIGLWKSVALQQIGQMQQSRRDLLAAVSVFGGSCDPNAMRTLLPFTSDLRTVSQTLQSRIPSPSGATPLRIAREQAEQMADSLKQARRLDQPINVMVLSDGQDTCPSTRPSGVWSQQSSTTGTPSVRYMAVGLALDTGSPAERDLQYLVSLTGGRYFRAQSQHDLTRAFDKLLKTYAPRSSTVLAEAPRAMVTTFQDGSRALHMRAYTEAATAFRAYSQAQPQDPAGHYNLAQALEATDRYKAAAASYRRYLAAAPGAPDRAAVQATLPVLERDYLDHHAYQVELIKSDLAYLQKYYDRLFNQDNASLAAEFRGFVLEKGEFYANLSDALEIEAPWVEQAERDVGQSLQRLARRVDNPTFDRDAVSLLAVPIGHLEELVEALSAHRPGN
jgi:TolA-binding protein